MPDAYALLLVERVDDRASYARYEAGFDRASFESYGGEIVALSDDAVAMEGEWPYSRVVLLRFPSQEQLDGWYASPEYHAVLGLRLGAARQRMASFSALTTSGGST